MTARHYRNHARPGDFTSEVNKTMNKPKSWSDERLLLLDNNRKHKNDDRDINPPIMLFSYDTDFTYTL